MISEVYETQGGSYEPWSLHTACSGSGVSQALFGDKGIYPGKQFQGAGNMKIAGTPNVQIYDILGVLLTKVRKPPAHMTDAHLNENPLLVGLRRLLSELRTKLARFAYSNSGSPF